jgi:zinc protease
MAPGAAFSDRVTDHSLPGGAKLVALSNPHAPTVTIAGTLKAGPALAPDGRYAVPGLVAAMLDRGTTNRSRIELARELEDHGLQLVVRASASTPTIVSFSAQGLAEEVPRLARLLVEVLRRPTFPEEELDKLRDQVLGSLAREREETSARAFAALTRALYPERHPLYRRPIEIRESEVASLTCSELKSFHAATYGLSDLVLATVGDVDGDDVAALLADEMAEWDGGSSQLYPEAVDGEPGSPETKIQIPDRPNIDVFMGHRGQLLRGTPDYPAAVLANSCLGQSTLTSRLGVAVRDSAGLTYGIYSRFFGTLHVAGPWATALGVSVTNFDRAIDRSRQVIDQYVEEGPTETELADERSALAGSYRVGLATNSGVARELVTALTAGEPVDRLDRFPEQLLSVDRDQVMEAIRSHLHPEQLVVTAAGDFEDR